MAKTNLVSLRAFFQHTEMNGPDPSLPDERYEQGLNKIREIFGSTGEEFLAKMRKMSPEMERTICRYPFAEIYSRPGLDLKTREIVTLSSLITLGYAQREIRPHIHGALNVGCTPEEIIEIILQLTVYAGFPAAINGLIVAAEVFEERGLKPPSETPENS